MEHNDRFLILNTRDDQEIIEALGSSIRLNILNLLVRETLNVNEIAQRLQLPQSTVATNIAVLERAGLIHTEVVSAKKGNQKRCSAAFDEILIQLVRDEPPAEDTIEVEMPIGLFTNFQVSAPCGLCSTTGIIGYLDVPDSFLNPDRMSAGLLWFETGFVEYQFPNNSLYTHKPLKALEVSAELSSETPGTNPNWLSDITLWINGIEVGTWTSPGDFGDRRGKFTPEWWKLEGSQYGLLKKWLVTDAGSFVDGVQVSSVTLPDLHLKEHHSIRVRLGVKEDAVHPGGINIFGRGFGNYNQAIILRLHF
ncbi:MAG TPA: helix-turn-helix domain-containing protein [Termitinemataceae bacterium]|uniref:ArsR/SmtB family transcription factor n=1 Tax=Treponema sp. J25 TaxID=2094121 RepID=UPI00104BA3A7|nr:helix-turn-helix domain-containing protein [Treponema sp. J25]TCW60909.1 ArsR family transcriptional regulator [Treponema sp. J25]HOJ99913.1 helix-turn-helix domain-containing protein [Termitinemataceae bacterium]HPQ01198.1 helix-turn-helix domain-containing protein [Termitinemataceae bacterium]